MDFNKIFIKDCSPTKMGGQAVIEGIMMRGDDRMAIAVRREDGTINVKETPIKPASGWMKWPLIRGVVSFVSSLVVGTSTLMYSAEVLEEDIPEDELGEPGKIEKWITDRFGMKAAFNFLLYASVVIALVISIGVFVLLPTWIVGLCGKVISNSIVLNLIEGVLRIVMFILYILAISRMKDIQRVFQYHGAEHQTIHCYENGLELIPENCMQFERLHPRCGTSFLMFVLIISLLLFSFLGWPNLAVRILSRLLLIPVIAGISYEVLRWAGRSDSLAVKILSVPGLLMQKITTAVPDESQLEVAIVAVKACLADRPPEERNYDVDSAGNLVNRENAKPKAAAKPEKTRMETQKEQKERDRKAKRRKGRERKPRERRSDTMELEIPVSTVTDQEPRYTEGYTGNFYYQEDSPNRDEQEPPVDDLYTRIIEGTAPIPEDVTTSQIQGIWPGESYTARQQYLYDLNEIMKDLSERAGR